MAIKKNYPLICIPVTGTTSQAILEEVKEIIELKPDLIEWRVDFFENVMETQNVLKMIEDIRTLTDLPLLFTIRSAHEGGEEIQLSESEKIELMVTVCQEADIQYIDYETKNDAVDIEKLSKAAKGKAIKLILSYHNFKQTPDDTFLHETANEAVAKGADIVKFALMPQTKADVYQVLTFTQNLKERLDIPIITMSMGELGALTRVIGWAYGSMLSFAVGVASSAPGQVSAVKLKQVIQETQALTGDWRE